jgi:transcription initiation factor TFIIIB Brf1 subunit/transcription initiation factor TFIIB
MYRAGAERAEAETLAALDRVAERLELSGEARSVAQELFLSERPTSERSKDAHLAASVYAGSLIAGDQRSQVAVAEAADVSRLTIQARWRELLEKAGFETPSW